LSTSRDAATLSVHVESTKRRRCLRAGPKTAVQRAKTSRLRRAWKRYRGHWSSLVTHLRRQRGSASGTGNGEGRKTFAVGEQGKNQVRVVRAASAVKGVGEWWGRGGPGTDGGEIEGYSLLLRILSLRKEEVPNLPQPPHPPAVQPLASTDSDSTLAGGIQIFPCTFLPQATLSLSARGTTPLRRTSFSTRR
jgi:hypothetical protein